MMGMIELGLLVVFATPFGLALWVWSRERLVNAHAGVSALPRFDAAIADCRFGVFPDIAPMVRVAVNDLHDLARKSFVRIEIAVRPGVTVRVHPTVLRAALQEAIRAAIYATPGGEVLVTGAAYGDEMHIRIADDGANTDRRARENLVRETEALIALQGGSISVETKPGHGTTVTVRLPRPRDRAPDTSEADEALYWTDQPA